jgi:hypothetical protein
MNIINKFVMGILKNLTKIQNLMTRKERDAKCYSCAYRVWLTAQAILLRKGEK